MNVKRIFLSGLGLPIVITALWFAQSRVFAPHRCVAVIKAGVHEADHASNTYTFAAYNIAHGRGSEYGASNWTGNTAAEVRDHLKKIVALIASNNIDVLVLNEVDFDSSWSQRINQAAVIASEANFHHYAEQRNIDVALPFRRYCFGNAILSRFPIEQADIIRLPALSKKEDFFAGNHDGLIVEIATPSGTVSVCAVHLEYRNEDVRVESIKHIEHVLIGRGHPFVALGDFNSSPISNDKHNLAANGENAIELLLASGKWKTGPNDRHQQPYLTFPANAPDRPLDWIFCSSDLTPGMPNVIQSDLSDHLMVVGTITVN